ncbi:hypothetical protein GSbR_19940 [Geobacter sp. SVR]|nr:hypothetical protein GSVR_17870 [Geobacter sp. SVR]GCF85394.1 hypothetical protein GSbR_19940 [Geobacter sp. SVR]
MMEYGLRILVLMAIGIGLAIAPAFATDEVFRAKLLAHKGNFLRVNPRLCRGTPIV